MTSISVYPTVPQFRYERMRRSNQTTNPLNYQRFGGTSSANQSINQIEQLLHSHEPLSMLAAAANMLQSPNKTTVKAAAVKQTSPLKLTHQSDFRLNNLSHNQSNNLSNNQSNNQSNNHHIYLPVKFSAPRLINEFDSESDSDESYDSEDQSADESLDESNDQSLIPTDWNDVSALLSLMDIKESKNPPSNQANNHSESVVSRNNNPSTTHSIDQKFHQLDRQIANNAIGQPDFHSPLENAIALTLQSMYQSIDRSVNQSVNEHTHRLTEEVTEAINDTESVNQLISQSTEAYNRFLSTRHALMDQSLQTITQANNQLMSQMKSANQSKQSELRSKLQQLQSIEQQELKKQQAVDQAIKEENEKRIKAEQEQKLKAEQEQAQKQENEQKLKAEQEQKEQTLKQQADIAAQQPPAQPAQPAQPTISAAQLEMQPSFEKWNHVKSLAQQFTGPKKLQYKTMINRTITQISQTVSSVRTKTLALLQLIQQARSNEIEHAYVIHVIVTKMLGQCETRIRLQLSSCFAFAGVLINLIVQDPLFGQCLRAGLCESCIYCYPIYLDRKNYASMAEYRTALGFASPDENEDDYFSRHAGYVSLLAAIMQQPGGAAHPYGLSHAWTWLARMLNSEPRTSTAAMLHAFLQVAAQSLYEAYPTQMRKMLHYLHSQFMPKLLPQAKTSARKAARTRLELWLTQALRDIQTTNSIQVPEGKVMQDQQDQDTSRVEVSAGDENGT